MWWKDMKMRICIIVGIIILLAIIIIPSGKLDFLEVYQNHKPDEHLVIATKAKG